MNRIKQALLSAALPWVVCVGLGCAGSAEMEEPKHERPSHWPRTFVAMVDDLAVRTDPMPEPGSPEAAELNDLFAWLPEIAADTSLKEADWTSAVKAGDRLKGGGEGRVQALEELKALAEKTREDRPPYFPEAHHSGDEGDHGEEDGDESNALSESGGESPSPDSDLESGSL